MRDAKTEVSKIRKIIKSKCPTVSVRMATGTSYGWVYIRGSEGKFNHFSATEKKCLKAFNLETGILGNSEVDIMPDERAYFIKHKRLSSDRDKFKYW